MALKPLPPDVCEKCKKPTDEHAFDLTLGDAGKGKGPKCPEEA